LARPRPDTPLRNANGLWAITAYFNPAGYRRRLKNYHLFRQHLTVPLVTVELSFNGHFELATGDAEILVQLHGGDVMWQKERLLNLARQHLPSACETVAWLDCDIILTSGDWAAHAQRALEKLALVQLFETRHDLPPDAGLDTLASWNAEPTAFSVIHRLATGHVGREALRGNELVIRFRSCTGLAWAIRREVLDVHRMYDATIVGSGDKANVFAALGMPETAAVALEMNARRAEHYLAWARPFAATVQRRVGYIPGRIFHLWHGDLTDRGYTRRHALLADFDPFTDIALDAQGSWRWSSDKPDLHAAIRRYFESRLEDGPTSGV
jgi:hypothetical protein